MNVVSLALLAAMVLVGCERPVTPASQATSSVPSPAASVAASAEPSAAAKDFGRYDADRNGKLSQTEFVEGRWGDIRFIRAPTEAEVASFKVGFAREFTQLDTDRDGSLTLSEFSASTHYSTT